MSESGTIEALDEKPAVERWEAEIEAAEKELKKFHERGEMTNKRFIDERDLMQAGMKWFNIFYANTNILESALYAQLPKPVVSRKYLDYNDDVGRVAALILQRAITEDLDDPEDQLDSTIRHCVQDRLVPGLATAWLRLETSTAPISLPSVPGITEAYLAATKSGLDASAPFKVEQPDEMGAEGQPPQMPAQGQPPVPQQGMPPDQAGQMQGQPPQQPPQEPQDPLTQGDPPAEQIYDQKVCVDYVYWKDFIWSPCRVWEERRWVGRKVYLTRDELEDRFGKVIGSQVPLNFSVVSKHQNGEDSQPKEDVLKKAVVYEIWNRVDRKIIWYSKGFGKLLDEKADFLQLRGFEPCPRPMLANTSTSSTIPRPDYYMIQDQYSELDTVNQRISMLVQACKVAGVYDKSAIGVSRMLTEGTDNQLIPVDNWAMFAEKGGLKGTIDFLPLEVIAAALRELNGAREAIKGQIYELTGIADIVRGASKASETLGAQQIKAQFASVRIKKLQDEVARFASDVMRIKGEIMVRHFAPEILIRKSNIKAVEPLAIIEPAMALLQSDEGFEWRIEVNADTLAQADYAAEKTDRTEFMAMMSKFMSEYPQMVQAAPSSIPLLLTMLKWSVAGFRNAKDIEGILDKEIDRMTREAKAPKPPPPPDPKLVQIQEEAKLAQQEHAMEMQAKQLEIQQKQQEFQQEQQMAMLTFQQKQQELMLEQRQAEEEANREAMREALEMQRLEMELAMDKQRQAQEMLFEQLMAALKLKTEREMTELKLDAAHEQAEIKAEQARTAARNGPAN